MLHALVYNSSKLVSTDYYSGKEKSPLIFYVKISPVTPPDGISSAKACMLELKMHDGSNLLLCAESYDDMKLVTIYL